MSSPSSSSLEGGGSPPGRDSVSVGSSVSTGLREEYEDLLRYAVVTPLVSGSLLVSQSSQQHKGAGGLKHVPRPGTSSLSPRPATPPRGAVRSGLPTELSKVDTEPSDTEGESQSSFADSNVPPQLQSHPMTHSRAPPSTSPPSSSPVPPYTSAPVTTTHTTITAATPTSYRHDGGDVKSHDLSDDAVNEGTDPEIVRLGSQLDGWCLDLKRNVLAEFEQSRLRMLERHREELHKERQHHGYILGQAHEELERCKELLVTYEQTIARKDHIITSLTRGLQKEKERVELQKSFSVWKVRHNDEKREMYACSLASLHYHRKLQCRVWGAWFGVIQGRWKQRAEKACQSQAEKVCVQLTDEYEERLAAAQRSLDEAQQEVAGLKAEKQLYEENMKKAFMRGVCALNLEAMSMFRHPHHDSTGPVPTNGYHGDAEVDPYPRPDDGCPHPVPLPAGSTLAGGVESSERERGGGERGGGGGERNCVYNGAEPSNTLTHVPLSTSAALGHAHQHPHSTHASARKQAPPPQHKTIQFTATAVNSTAHGRTSLQTSRVSHSLGKTAPAALKHGQIQRGGGKRGGGDVGRRGGSEGGRPSVVVQRHGK